jgi:hypothetical protein
VKVCPLERCIGWITHALGVFVAITSETLRLVAALRNQVNAITDGAVRSLTVAWVRAWDEIVWEVVAALDELLAMGGDRWPTRRQIERTRRAMSALDLARQALERLAGLAAQTITTAATEAARVSMSSQPDIRTTGQSVPCATSPGSSPPLRCTSVTACTPTLRCTRIGHP